MEVYTLDSLLRRETVIDRFESLIWTERFQAYGDFELRVHSTSENRRRLTAGTWLAMNESYRVMTIESVEDTVDDEGRQILIVKGPSLEEIMDDRIALGALTDLTTNPKWTITDTPTNVARKIFHDICIAGTIAVEDIIPFVIEASIFPADTIPEPTATATLEFEPQSVYEAISNIAQVYDFGFRLVRNFDTSQLYFDVYMGSDRTTSQSTLPAVIFAPNLDNLKNTTEFTTTDKYKNVAIVISPVGHRVVYPDLVDPSVAGFERHVLVVKADDIDDPTPSIANALMDQRGKEALAKARTFSGFDGELSQESQYVYGRDYNLGDLVELRNTDGATSNMQVIEQIFVSDRDGERRYPTLAINLFITPGSWLAWDFNQHWFDLDSNTTLTWGSLA